MNRKSLLLHSFPKNRHTQRGNCVGFLTLKGSTRLTHKTCNNCMSHSLNVITQDSRDQKRRRLETRSDVIPFQKTLHQMTSNGETKRGIYREENIIIKGPSEKRKEGAKESNDDDEEDEKERKKEWHTELEKVRKKKPEENDICSRPREGPRLFFVWPLTIWKRENLLSIRFLWEFGETLASPTGVETSQERNEAQQVVKGMGREVS